MLELGKKGRTYEVVVGGATFIGAPLTSSAMKALSEKHTRRIVRPGTLKKDFDADGFAKALFFAMVQDWRDVVLDGVVVGCEDDMKERLYEEHGDVVAEVIDAFNEARRLAREEERKNS